MVEKSGVAKKFEWKKEEKHLYMPKAKPEVIDVPPMNFFTLSGIGDPNSEAFADYIEALYAATYAVRMAHKSKQVPDGYYEYTVYPLEGEWTLTEEGRRLQLESGSHSVVSLKEHLAFKLMIRQPSFLTEALAKTFIASAYEKKGINLLKEMTFETITDGQAIQMLHTGPYDSEPESFHLMEDYAKEQGLERLSKDHREIYLSDARKVKPEALKTVLRFRIKPAQRL